MLSENFGYFLELTRIFLCHHCVLNPYFIFCRISCLSKLSPSQKMVCLKKRQLTTILNSVSASMLRMLSEFFADFLKLTRIFLCHHCVLNPWWSYLQLVPQDPFFMLLVTTILSAKLCNIKKQNFCKKSYQVRRLKRFAEVLALLMEINLFFLSKTYTPVFQKIHFFPGYYMNLKQNPRTLLPKFFGLYCYSCNAKNVRIIVMNNLLPSGLKMHHKFDLKGTNLILCARIP